MAGTRTNANPVRSILHGYSSAAVTANAIMTEYVMPFNGRIRAIQAYAGTAGTGGANTVLDVLLNGTSIFTTTANRPTLLATSTGLFANLQPDTQAVQVGDLVTLKTLSISTTGQARVSLDVAVELA